MANIISVTREEVDKTGFFCFMSKKKAPGYGKKMLWLKARLAEGMRIKILELPERGFIEYIPGELAWRAVQAADYMFIHCLWVVGKSKGKGFGKILLDQCIEDARSAGMAGVAMLTSDRVWLADSRLLLQNGFTIVEQQPPFSLLVKKFKKAPDPALYNDWQQRSSRYKKGLTVFRTDQCPYIEDAARTVREAAEEKGIGFREIVLSSARQVQEQAPSPYGVFSIVYKGKLLSYHYMLPKDLLPLLGE